MFLFQELKWRNLIQELSDESQIEKLLNKGKVIFYCGFDPTAVSLTIGHLVQIITILLLQKKGHKPFILLGKATALIGDPKEIKERKLLSSQEVNNNFEKIQKQLKKILSEDIVTFVDNYDWLSQIDIISFLKNYGNKLNVNYMISKDKISKRLEKGISYSEFSYMLLQALDFYYLYKNFNVRLQLGGSDQWGNITTGLELIRKLELNNSDNKPLGMCCSLLLDSKGHKIGKSENNAIWLDEELTTPYQMYQFFLNIEDKNVINCLKILTLLEVEKINELEKNTKINSNKRLAQKELAKQVVTFIHGKKIFEECFRVNNILFFKDNKDNSFLTDKIIKKKDFILLKKHLTFFVIDKKILLVDALIQTKLADSKNKARNLILSGAIKVFKKTIKDISFCLDSTQTLFTKYILLTKKNKFNALIIDNIKNNI